MYEFAVVGENHTLGQYHTMSEAKRAIAENGWKNVEIFDVLTGKSIRVTGGAR